MDSNRNRFQNANNFNTSCFHLKLQRAAESTAFRNIYHCEQCKQQCQVTFTNTLSFDLSSSPSHFIEFEELSFNSNNNTDAEMRESINSEKNQSALPTSRLRNEFVCLNEILGQGGFGSVGKFKHKKDDKIYAIKKTKATDRNEREVEVLSYLQHQNIVRYYNCWIEKNDFAFPKDSEEEEESSDDSIGEKLAINGSVLYIQMEFCEKRTLREAIDSGDLVRNRVRMLKLFRQLVEGISYFHSKGVIHRDLKPKNVFLNSDDCVKIGDFGLATGGLRPNPNITTSDIVSNSLTKQCGTHCYMAPELTNGNGQYSTKVDMYSLGIIVFEMCHKPFKTETERFHELEKIRKPIFTIPLQKVLSFPKMAFAKNNVISPTYQERQELIRKEKQENKIQTKNTIQIIKQLLIHDPEKRPSAEELLKSSNMPPPLLDNVPEFFQFVDFLLFSRKGSLKYPEYYELMQRCLDQTTSEKDIFEWLSNLTIRVKRKKTLRRIKSISISQSPSIPAEFFIKRCQEMGGQYFQPASLFPKLSIEGDYKSDELNELARILAKKSEPAEFINKNGTPAVLPMDSYTSFARHISTYNITDFKRYCVNQVFTDGVKYNALLQEPSTELAFDIVTPPSAKAVDLRRADAEVIQVIERVLKDCKLSYVVLQINHHLLIEAILVYCKVPLDRRSRILSQSNLKSELTQLVRDGLLTFLNLFTSFDLLKARGNLKEVKFKFENLPDWDGSEAALLANQAFNELEEIQNICQAKDKKGFMYPVFIDVSVGHEYYETHSGFIFKFTSQPNPDEDPFNWDVFGDRTELATGG